MTYDPDAPTIFESREFIAYCKIVKREYLDGETYGALKRRLIAIGIDEPGNNWLWEAITALVTIESLIEVAVAPMKWKHADKPRKAVKATDYAHSLCDLTPRVKSADWKDYTR